MKKLILTILFPLIAWSANASGLQTTINNFFCSDDLQTISDAVSYPIFVEFRQSVYTKSEFIEAIKNTRHEDGLYKLGKKCVGFLIATTSIKNTQEGATVRVESLGTTGKVIRMEATIYLNNQGKIVGVHSN